MKAGILSLFIIISGICANSLLAFDAWTKFLSVAPTVAKEGIKRRLPSGVEAQKEFRAENRDIRLWSGRGYENVAFKLEPESAQLYQKANAGTPFIGIVNLNNGTIYLHPTVLTYSVAKPDIKELYRSDLFWKISPEVHAQLPNSWKKILKMYDQVILEPQKYTSQQLPSRLYERGAEGKFPSFDPVQINSDDFLQRYGGFTVLENARHKGEVNENYKMFVYHSRNDAFVMSKERDKIFALCHPNATSPISSHECLVEMLNEHDEPHLGFSITKQQIDFCQKGPLDKIGQINGLYFSGTSASQNDSVYVRGNGTMAEREARKIYNSLAASLGIETIGPCQETFQISRNFPNKTTLPIGEKLELEFKITADGQASEAMMENGYNCTLYKNEQRIANNQCSLLLDAKSGTEIEGRYQVVASPIASPDLIFFSNAVTVGLQCPTNLAPPKFESAPAKLFQGEEGSALSISFNVSGDCLSYTWKKWDEKNQKWRGRGIEKELKIKQFDASLHSGKYQFTAGNSSAKVESEFEIQ